MPCPCQVKTFRFVNIQYNPQTQKFGNLSKESSEVDMIGGGDTCQVSTGCFKKKMFCGKTAIYYGP